METVIVINPFEVQEDRRGQALEAWDRIAAYMERQDGFVSARLHRSIDPRSRFAFVTVAEWDSAEKFAAAFRSDEFVELDHALAEFPHYPGVYELIRT
jgi:heme oxygenase (mycobilin-producing)